MKIETDNPTDIKSTSQKSIFTTKNAITNTSAIVKNEANETTTIVINTTLWSTTNEMDVSTDNGMGSKESTSTISIETAQARGTSNVHS
jgi:hypothetical protein